MKKALNPLARSLIIIGVTNEDKVFRPSNWAERLCELAAVFDDRGMFSYSKNLHPTHFKNAAAVRVNSSIISEQPELWKQLTFFVGLHELQFVEYISPFDAFMKTVLLHTQQHLFGEVANDEVNAPFALEA